MLFVGPSTLKLRPINCLPVLFLLAFSANHAQAALKAPVLTTTNPLTVQPGVTNTFTIKAQSGSYNSTSKVLINGAPAIDTVIVNDSKIITHVAVPLGATGSLTVQVVNSTGKSNILTEGIAVKIDVEGATRLLEQTTFGPTLALMKHVEQEGAVAWINEQFAQPSSLIVKVPNPAPSYCGVTGANCVQTQWWNIVLNNNDQLRQRVAYALSQIDVISFGKDYYPYIPSFQNNLVNDAFGNWETIMKDVTLSTGMGFYLDMVNSAKTSGGQIANENYARENLQLFNIGLFALNQDGTQQLDRDGNPIPAYTEAQVEAFARAYTGWTYANANGTIPTSFNRAVQSNYDLPMVAVESLHDTSEKELLSGFVMPAGQTAEEDLDQALHNIFMHPNVPPFISRQLIQKLVTGNPSPAYVARVAAVFTNNGHGVRGDMKAIITAILTDEEAREGDNNSTADGGHLREPMLWATSVLRAIGYTDTNAQGHFLLSNWTQKIGGEWPYESPSVFNFYPPDYVIPNTDLNAPEFSMENTGSIGAWRQFADALVTGKTNTGVLLNLSATSPLGQAAANPATLVDMLGTMFMHTRMDPNIRTAIINEVSGITDHAQRARVATYLVITASAYKINL